MRTPRTERVDMSPDGRLAGGHDLGEASEHHPQLRRQPLEIHGYQRTGLLVATQSQ
jgi:hypothetical protein